MVRKLVFIGCLLSVSGCISRGKDFSSDIKWIQKEKTPQSEITGRLGQPYRVGSSGGTPTWTYGYYRFRLFGESHTKELKLYWKGDRVDDYSFSSSFPADRRAALPSN